MKTLEQAQAYRDKVRYRVICEHCHTVCIADEEDFDSFYGAPEHADNERAWKCPVCGHVTVEKNQGLLYSVCDAFGRFVAVTLHC